MSLRTVKALEQSFKKLLAEKPISKITIKEITDCSGVSRMTFYYHFESVYDLARYVSEQNSLKNETDSTDAKGVLINIFTAFYNEKLATYNVYSSLNKAKAYKYLNKNFEKVLEEIIKEETENKTLKVSVSFLYDYCLSAIIGVTEKWFNSKMDLPPNEIGGNLYELTVNLIKSLIVNE